MVINHITRAVAPDEARKKPLLPLGKSNVSASGSGRLYSVLSPPFGNRAQLSQHRNGPRNRSSPAALVSRTTRWALQSRLTTSSALGLTICHSSRVGVRAATAKIVTAEELGGAEVHSRVSGVTHHYALDDRHALGIARLIVGNLNRTKNVSLDLRQPCEPVYPAEEIYGVIPPDTRRPYEVREVIARIVDGRCSPADPARASRRSRSPQRSR